MRPATIPGTIPVKKPRCHFPPLIRKIDSGLRQQMNWCDNLLTRLRLIREISAIQRKTPSRMPGTLKEKALAISNSAILVHITK
jgi:hypothetical protein